MPGPAATRPSKKNKHTALEAKKVTQSRQPTQEVQAESAQKNRKKSRKKVKKKQGRSKQQGWNRRLKKKLML